ncbi:MAG TPA: hypothetical protein VGE66_14135 [Chitinophagaceae bacterium]
MSHRTLPGKRLLVMLCIMVAALSCQKPDTEETPTEVPPPIATFESLFTFPTKAFCGSTFTSNLKIKDGKDIGSVSVSNDDLYLYLTYNLEQNWYLVDVQSYAGTGGLIPRTSNGNPNHGRFPGKQGLSPCDMRQTFTFRVALSALTPEEANGCAGRLFVAMRASVRHIANVGACTSGLDEEAWAAPILINPHRKSEWATAFYYCLQDCPPPPPPAPAWCVYGQGYWFASGKKAWCGEAKVTFGTLIVTQQEGHELWSRPGKRSTMEKAFFQAAALKLSQECFSEGKPIPEAIRDAYQIIEKELVGLDKLQDLNNPLATEELDNQIQNAAGAIGKWICANKCNPPEDPTSCTN